MATRHLKLLSGLGLAAFAAMSATSSLALADPSAEDIATARSLGTAGVQLAESGDCKGAIPKLQGAEQLFHAPTTADRLGECQISVGQIVAGTETLNRVVRETLPAGAPAAFTTAQQRAQAALQAALPKIAQLKIHVDGVPADKVTVTVDDVKVSSLILDSNRPTDPGSHQVKATATGFTDATQSVQLAPGSTSTVTLTMTASAAGPAAVPTPAGATPAPTTATPASQPADAGSGSSGSKVLPITLLAVGGAGLVVGSVFGVLALGTKSSLDSACSNKVCPSSSKSNIDSLNMQATVSSIGFGVGVVGAALGVYFLLTSGGSSEAAPAGASTPPTASLTVQPWVGLGSAGLGGTFQ